LILLTIIATICADYLSESLTGLAESWNISTKFIDLKLEVQFVAESKKFINVYCVKL
ncbi:15228_t:CDS:1, partial [Racocetra fulgida]